MIDLNYAAELVLRTTAKTAPRVLGRLTTLSENHHSDWTGYAKTHGCAFTNDLFMYHDEVFFS
jgi:hypothetical protein